MIALRIRTEGIDKMRKIVEAAKKRALGNGGNEGGNNTNIDGMSRFSDYVAARAYSECIKHFQKEEGPDGNWKPLSLQTLLRRKKGTHKGISKILQDTGRLKASILFRGIKDKAVVFTNMIYANIHQEGYKHIPKRTFLWASNDFMKKMSTAYAKYVMGKM